MSAGEPETAFERCHLFEQGDPAAAAMPDGRVCGGIAGQPCRRCKKLGLGVRGMAEFFAQTMGYEPGRGRR